MLARLHLLLPLVLVLGCSSSRKPPADVVVFGPEVYQQGDVGAHRLTEAGTIRLWNHDTNCRLRLSASAFQNEPRAELTVRVYWNGEQLDQFLVPYRPFTRSYDIGVRKQRGREWSELEIRTSTPGSGLLISDVAWGPCARTDSVAYRSPEGAGGRGSCRAAPRHDIKSMHPFADFVTRAARQEPRPPGDRIPGAADSGYTFALGSRPATQDILLGTIRRIG